MSSSEQAKVFAAHGGTRKTRLQRLKLDVVNLAPGELEKAIARFKADPRVESVEIDHLRSAAGVPNDSSYASQWALPKIGWEQVYGVTNPAGTATVAILDAGIDASHPDLAGKVIAGTSILDPGSDGRTDASGHGTMLAGIIAAAADNGTGIAGVAPAGVKVMPVNVLDAAGTGLDSNIIQGITWAADHGADVILMPFSNPTFSQALQEAIDYAWSKGAVLIAATGNGGTTNPTFPAGDRGVVGVSATTQDDTLYFGANRGPDTFVVAPGVAIYSTTRGGSYGEITGTSASAAVVAGIASYMKAVDPTLTNGLIVSRLGQSADQNEGMTLPGYGLVNLADALNNVNMTPLQPAGVGATEPFQDPYVAAGACDKLRITSTPYTLTVGEVSGAIRVAAHNGNFNCQLPSGMNVVSLASTSPNHKFYLDAAGTTEITQVTLVEGPRFDQWNNTTHDANIYYKDLMAGSPTITATLPSLANPSASQTETVNPAPQSITFTSPAPTSARVDGPTYVPAATGGASGNPVVFTIAPASGSVCSLSGGVVSFRTAGSCVIYANQAGNANYIVAPQVQQSCTVGKGNQASVTLTVTPSAITYGNSAVLSASGGSGTGGFSFSAGSSTGCSVSGSTLTVTNASGDCGVTATRATDINYLEGTSAPVQVTLLKGSQATVTVTAPASVTFGETGKFVSGSGGSGSGAFSYSANDSTACSVDPVSGALTLSSATGSCSVSATRAADNNYDPATSLSATISLIKGAQSTVTVSVPSSAYFGEGGVYATASGGSGSGAYSYTAVGSACQIDGSTGLLTITDGSGACSVSATKAGDNDYNAATSAVASVTITKAPQAQLAAVITPSTLTYGSSASLTTTGGSGGGAVSFNASGSGCQIVNGTTLAVVNASGVCSVTATKGEDGNYQAATSAPVSVTLSKAAQATVSVSAPTSALYGETGLSAVASGGSSSASYSYSATGACSIDASTGALTFSNAPGTCSVTATKPSDDNYTAATSAAASINVNKALQPAITALVTPSIVSFGSTAALSISGGAGDGAVSFTASGTGCQVSGSTLTVLNASGSCSVTAVKAADELYEAATSQPTSVTLAKATQAPVTVSAPQSVVYRQSGESVTASGGSGDGSYSYSTTGACTVNAASGALSFNSGIGTCSVTATKAADDNFTASVSPAATITVNKAPQSTLTAVVTPSTVSYNSIAALSTSGGDGGGTVTFSASGTGCQVSGSTLSVTNASGNCSVTASKAGDANYEAAGSLPVSVTLAKADQAAVSVSAPESAHYGETGLSAAASGGSSSASYLYSATGACFIDASSGALTFSNATGTCSVTATKPADNNYNAATSAVATINVNKAAQPTFSLTVTPSSVIFGSTATVATSGGAGGGEVSYQVTGTGCQIVGTTLSVLNASASCSVTATKASDANYEAATSQAVSVTLNQALQSAVSVSAPASAFYGQSGLSAAASGGSGTGSYSYSATGACTVNAASGALSFNATGTCSVTASKAADNNYSIASSTAATFTVNKAAQSTLAAIVTPSSVSYGSTATLTTSGGNGGGLVTFSATGTGCQVSGSTLSVTNASGTCSVTARKAADANYEAAGSLPVSVTLTKADQTTVSVSAPASAHYGETGLSATATGGSSSAGYLYSATGACSIDASSGALTFGNATGTCSVTATKPADDNYNAATSAAAVIDVNKAPQPTLTLTVTPSTLQYGSSATLSTSGGAGEGRLSFVTGGNGCQLSGNTLSVTNASGSCTITASKESDLNYEAATSNTVTVTLQQAAQQGFAITVPATAYYGQGGLSAAASGGSGGGSVSYSAAGSCSVNANSGAITITSGTGNCVISATKAADINFTAASAQGTVTVTKGAQAPLTAVVTPQTVPFGTTAALSISGGSGGGAVSFSASGTGCSVAGTTLSVLSAGGSCSVTATKLGDLNYQGATSAPVGVTLSKGTQQAVQVSAPLSAVIGESGLFARASGGSGSGDYRYDGSGSTACSVDAQSGALTITASFGSCSITAIKLGDANYNDSARSTAAVLSVGKADQAPLFVVVTPHPVPYGVSAALSTTGGSGDGAVSFSSTGAGCSVAGSALTVNAAGGACSVTAMKGADDQYKGASSAPFTVTLVKGNQAPVTVTVPATARYQQSGLFAAASGGSAGAYGYTASGSCSVHNTTGALTITASSGSCTVTATRAGDGNYHPATATATLTATKGAQRSLTALATPATVIFGNSATLSASGGDGSGSVTFDAGGSTGCRVTGTSLSVIDASGSCSVTATKAGDGNWEPVTSAALTVTLSKGSQAAVIVSAPATARLFQGGLLVTASGGSGSGSYSYSAGSSTACSVDPATGVLTITAPSGSCLITATRGGDSNYVEATSTAASVAVNKALQTTVVAVATPSAVTYGSSALLSITGGSGSGSVSYSAGSSNGCRVTDGATLVVDNASGSCSVTATKLGDTEYDDATSAPLTVTLNKGTQAAVTVSAPGSASYNQAGLFATASGGSGGGAYSYSAGGSTACQVNSSTGAISITSGTGTCAISASKGTDNNYLPSAASAPASVNVNKAEQNMLAVSAPATLPFGSTAKLTVVGGSTNGPVSFSAGDSTGCRVTLDVLSVTSASGNCFLTATRAADPNFNATTSAPVEVKLEKGAQKAVTVTAPLSARYAQTGVVARAAGGDGTGAYSYSAGSSTACSVDAASGAVTISAASGSCAITAVRGGDTNYLASAESAAATISVGKGTQPPLAVIVNPSSVGYGSSAQLTTSGGAGSGAVSFSLSPQSTGCEISGATLTAKSSTGSCSVSATKAADDYYNAATSAAATVPLTKGTQAGVTVTAPASALYGESGLKANASGGSGSGAYSYLATGSTACRVDAAGNITITSGTGDCIITATRAGDDYYYGASPSAPATVAVSRAQQTVTLAPLEVKTYGDADFSVSAASSAGVALQYSSDNPAVATITPQGVIKVKGQGRATITASQPGDLNYAPATAVQQPLTVEKALLTVKANSASRAYGAADPVFGATFSGFVNGENGAVLSGAPAFSTDAQPSSPVGSYRIFPALGTLEAANYSFAFQEGVFAIGLANQTITFNPLAARSYGSGSFDLEYTPGASGNPVTFTSSDQSVATVTGRTVTIKKAGTTQIVAYQAGTANYAEATAQQTLSVAKAPLMVVAENKERPYNSANPALTFRYSGFLNGDDESAVSGAPLLDTDARPASPVGNYGITVARGTLDAVNYSFTFVNGVLAVGKASQSVVFDTLPPKTYGDLSFTLSAQGGASGNPVTFASSDTSIATISGNTATIVGAGKVTITASQNGDSNYAPASSQQPLQVAKATLTVRANDSSRRYNSPNPVFGVSYTGFVRNDTPAGVVSGAPAVTTEAKADSVPGPYPIIPALGNLFSTKYDFRYENGTLTVLKGLQAKVTVAAPPSASYAQSGVVVAAAGGDGSGAFSFQTVNSTACSIEAETGLLTISSGTGTCSVTATRAGDSSYEASTPSLAAAIAITRANQAPLSVTAPQSLLYGSGATLSATGGSGTGGVTFTGGSSTGCQVTGNLLSVTNASGSCSVGAARGGDANFLPATSATATVNLQRAGQSPVTVSVPARASYGQQGVLAQASGGSGTGAYSYSAGSSTACSVNASSGAITIISATGSCAISATRAADNNHNPAAASDPAILVIDRADQALLTVRAPSSLVYGSSATLSASGGSGSGAVTFSAGSSTGCAVSGSTLTVTDAGGSCSVTATREADNNHKSATSAAAAVTLAQAVPVVSWSNPRSIIVGTALSARELNATATPEGGTFVYSPPAGSVLAIGVGQRLTVSYTPSDTRNYTTVTRSVYITVESATKPVPVSGPPTGSYENMKRGSNFLIIRTEPGTGAVAGLGTTSETTFTDNTKLKPNTIYQYSVASDSDPTQTVFMTVRTPLGSGWNIIAVPYDTSGTPVGDFFAERVSSLYQWVPTGAPTQGRNSHSGSYVAVNAILPGMGYFVKSYSRNTMLNYSGDPGPETTTVTLKPGWTMIANPTLDSRINIGESWLVDDVPLSIFINAGKIGGSIYWWNGVTYDSWSIMQNNPQIEPWKGYWMLNLDTVEHRLTIK